MKANLLFDFKNSKSLKVYPLKQRSPIKSMSANEGRIAMKALNASEKELKYMIGISNRRMEKLDSLVKESFLCGYHLEADPFIPEYLGFEEIVLERDDTDFRMYSKDGYSISRTGDQWVILSPKNVESIVPITNMFMAINILSSCGMDINFKDYMDGNYNLSKTLEEIVDESIGFVKGGNDE